MPKNWYVFLKMNRNWVSKLHEYRFYFVYMDILVYAVKVGKICIAFFFVYLFLFYRIF